MTESYPNADENRGPESVRGIPRPFADFEYGNFLRAFDRIVGAKQERSEGENALIRRAEKFCRILSKFPGIRRIWVCNSLSMNAADGDSDIDLFVETAPGMIWTGRVMTTLFFSLLGARRHGKYVKGRFCLSFFAVENADLRKVAVEDDAYLYEWARRLIPVDGRRFPKSSPLENVLVRRKSSDNHEAMAPACGLFSWAGELFGNPKPPNFFVRAVERAFKKLFLGKTLREYERLGKPWGIVISDEFLKFHPEDRRIEIRDRVRKELEGKWE